MKFGGLIWVSALTGVLLTGCSIEKIVRKNDERYATPGAMDSPLTGVYNTYSLAVLDTYRLSHQWTESGCRYRGVEVPSFVRQSNGRSFQGRDIVEKDGKTWLRFSEQNLFDFDPWVRSVKWISKEKGKDGQVEEVGLRPICLEYWWRSSHYLMLLLRRTSMAAHEASLAAPYRDATWSTRSFNGLSWRVAEVPLDRLERRPLNGVGGSYQTWFTELGDTGYVVAFEMGASQESLAYPKAHADIEAVFMHLVNSLRVERMAP